MRVQAYFVGWRDIYYLPFVKKHYGSFCERLVLYDQFSTDGTVELALELGFEVRSFGDPKEFDELCRIRVKNNCWKESRDLGVDYVIVADADEFVTIPLGMKASLPRVVGLNMMSRDLPKEDIFEIKNGRPYNVYAKQAVFCPERIQEINFTPGGHRCSPIGEISREGAPATMFHYAQIGGSEKEALRHKIYVSHLGEKAFEGSFGNHYLIPEEEKRCIWESSLEICPELWMEPLHQADL